MDMKERQRLAGKALLSAAYFVAAYTDPQRLVARRKKQEWADVDALEILTSQLDQLGMLEEYKDANGKLHLPTLPPELTAPSLPEVMHNAIERAKRGGMDTEDLVAEAHELGVDISNLTGEQAK